MTNKSRKKSKIWIIEKNELQRLFDTHHSISSILKEIGLKAYNGNHQTLNKRILMDDINLSLFKINKAAWMKAHLLSSRKVWCPANIFVEHSLYNNNTSLKNHLLKLGVVEYKCSLCGNLGIHNDAPLSLQLDHINGISDDNRIENLRLLCPNCHSQTDTFSGKRHKINYKCVICNSPIVKNSTKCRSCEKISRKGINILDWPPLSVIIDMLRHSSFVKVGETLKRSDNSIRKFLIRNKIDPKTLSSFEHTD